MTVTFMWVVSASPQRGDGCNFITVCFSNALCSHPRRRRAESWRPRRRRGGRRKRWPSGRRRKTRRRRRKRRMSSLWWTLWRMASFTTPSESRKGWTRGCSRKPTPRRTRWSVCLLFIVLGHFFFFVTVVELLSLSYNSLWGKKKKCWKETFFLLLCGSWGPIIFEQKSILNISLHTCQTWLLFLHQRELCGSAVVIASVLFVRAPLNQIALFGRG